MASRDRPDEFASIYRFMTQGMGLTGADLLVYARVFSFCRDEDGSYYESRSHCAEFLGLSARQVRRSMVNLVSGGLVVQVGEVAIRGGKKVPAYKVVRSEVRRAAEAVGGHPGRTDCQV